MAEALNLGGMVRTSTNGIFSSDVILRTALIKGLEEIRATPYLLDFIFSGLSNDELTAAEYGDREVETARNWFLTTDIPVTLAYRQADVVCPVIAISLEDSSEGNSTLGDIHYDPQESIEAKEIVIQPAPVVSAFTPKSYDPDTGTVTLPDGVTTDNVFVGMLLFDTTTNRSYPILDVVDDSTFTIAEDTVARFTRAVIAPRSSFYIARMESVEERESYRLDLYCSNPVHLLYLNAVTKFVLFRYKQAYLEARGFERTVISSSGLRLFKREGVPEHIFTRVINVTGFVRQYWPKDITPAIDGIGLTIDVEALDDDDDSIELLGLSDDESFDSVSDVDDSDSSSSRSSCCTVTSAPGNFRVFGNLTVDGLTILGGLTLGQFPAASSSNEGALLYDSGSGVIRFSDGQTWNIVGGDVVAAADVTVAPSGNLSSTTVQAALEELQADIDVGAAGLSAHLADTVDAHDASAVSVAAGWGGTATEVQGALAELMTAVDDVGIEPPIAWEIEGTDPADPVLSYSVDGVEQVVLDQGGGIAAQSVYLEMQDDGDYRIPLQIRDPGTPGADFGVTYFLVDMSDGTELFSLDHRGAAHFRGAAKVSAFDPDVAAIVHDDKELHFGVGPGEAGSDDDSIISRGFADFMLSSEDGEVRTDLLNALDVVARSVTGGANHPEGSQYGLRFTSAANEAGSSQDGEGFRFDTSNLFIRAGSKLVRFFHASTLQSTIGKNGAIEILGTGAGEDSLTIPTGSRINLGSVTLSDAGGAYALSSALTAHTGAVSGAHAASAISNTPSGNLAATTAQGALDELQTDVDTRATSVALTTHAALTAAHGATGAVVGTTNTQTLTNKTFSDPITSTVASGVDTLVVPSGARIKFGNVTLAEGSTVLSCSSHLAASQNIKSNGGSLQLGTAGQWVENQQSTLKLKGAATNGATAVGVTSDTGNAFTTAGAKIHTFANAGVEKLAVDKDGVLVVPSSDSSGTPGDATINKPSGRSAMSDAQAFITITNSLVTAATKVFVTWRSTHNSGDVFGHYVVSTAGSFYVALANNESPDPGTSWVFDWFIVN